MAEKKATKNLDTTTEARIKKAAHVVFVKKGYAATRTRDIAEEAGINLALLNYYFRSKEKLFTIIMSETVKSFFQNMAIVLNEEQTILEEKIEKIATSYIDMMIQEPEIPTFIVSELRSNPKDFLEKLPIPQLVHDSIFLQQFQKAVAAGKISEPNPLHFLMNLLGLIVFPFIAKPLLQSLGNLNDLQFNQLMLDRKQMIPLWMKAMMQTK